ncbi:hypothetical protein CTI12_AA598950 [Artemisia annua]|uniref:Transposase-associated domain-containing protein n=1 Tax=Artemisia annua TaxID=35608 RepID=A0A2U1KIC4_ARTAN|nr:hypothetical protein CTI12_AA598950 [Artemisia annua]
MVVCYSHFTTVLIDYQIMVVCYGLTVLIDYQIMVVCYGHFTTVLVDLFSATMERQWIYGMSLNDPEFMKGVESFLIAAESHRVAKGDTEIFCPCSKYSYSFAFQYRAFEIKFDCMMAKCFQQKGIWECGYYPMKSMYDLALYKQADFPKHLWDDTRHLKPMEIDQVVLMTLNAFHKFVVDPLDATAPQ